MNAASTAQTGPTGRRLITCRNPTCGKKRRNSVDGLCGTCSERWKAADRPATLPPPMSRQEQGRRGGKMRGKSFQASVENYRELTREFGLSKEQAAVRLSVSLRSITRYENELYWRGIA